MFPKIAKQVCVYVYNIVCLEPLVLLINTVANRQQMIFYNINFRRR